MVVNTVVLPGDIISPESLPTPLNGKPLKLGPGLRLVPPSTVTAVLAGSLIVHHKKNAVWVENVSGRVGLL